MIAGTQRLLAARALGWVTIPTAYVELDEVREAVWMLLDNRSFGYEDDDLVGELLAELRERGADLDLTGFERVETDRLLRRLVVRDKEPDALPALNTDLAESKPGVSSTARTGCPAATRPTPNRSTLLAGAEPLLAVTDPPYGVQLDNGWRDRAGLNGRRRSANHATTTLRSDERADWAEAYTLVSSLQILYVWHASRHACAVQAGIELAGFEVRQQLIWDKGRFALSRQHYHWAHEPCLYATRADSKVPWLGSRTQSTVWEAASPKMARNGGRADRAVDHPTQKPVALYRRPIENHVRSGEAVYDPFAGSGTALIAAELTGTIAYLIEIDLRCCDLIRTRYEEFTDGR